VSLSVSSTPCQSPFIPGGDNKVMVIDGDEVITGSFNFTKSAEYHNAENLLVLKSKELGEALGHSERYWGR
jgi:phosphatidylserine/phosphatidylglycerophosphate/cardiolipin synthase-like enzyme